MDYSDPQVHRRSESLGTVALSLGDVLTEGRARYGNPWLSILRVPRQSSGFYIYLTPIDFGLTYSFHAFSTGGDGRVGGYVGEPTLLTGELTHRGVTTEFWSAFTQNYAPTLARLFNGEYSALDGGIR